MLQADVIVVGSGIAGASVAAHFAATRTVMAAALLESGSAEIGVHALHDAYLRPTPVLGFSAAKPGVSWRHHVSITILNRSKAMLKHTFRSRTGATGICGVDIYECFDRLTVVITELNRNRGISITNCYHELATDIAQGLVDVGVIDDPRAILWVEHYEGAASPKAPWNGETWDEVTMQWDGRRFRAPTWKPCAGDRFKRPALGKSIRPHEIRI